MPDTPPLHPDDPTAGDPARRILLRVLLATAAVPAFILLGSVAPPEPQDALMFAGMSLVLLIPLVCFVLGLVAFFRGQTRHGWAYVAGSLMAGVIGFGACTFAVMATY